MDHDVEVITRRGFGEMTDEKKIYQYASIVTAHWFRNGNRGKLADYELVEDERSNPYYSLTLSEFATLRLMQKNLQDNDSETKAQNIEGWHLIGTKHYDSYSQETWENAFGERVLRTVPRV